LIIASLIIDQLSQKQVELNNIELVILTYGKNAYAIETILLMYLKKKRGYNEKTMRKHETVILKRLSKSEALFELLLS